MAERHAYAHGVFNWTDLCTGDTEAAKAFYSALFGLSFEDEVNEDGNLYTLGLKYGRPVLGMLAQPPELGEIGVPYNWETYIKVDDAEAALARVAEAGGTPMGPVVKVSSAGYLAVAADPTGAVVILWEPIDHQGAHFVNEHGTMCWNELVTDDIEAAMSFYSKLLGWTAAPVGAGELVGIRQGDDFIGSATPVPEGLQVPGGCWAVYFAVDDCDAAVEQCRRLGGRVNVPAMDQPPGRMAQLADDQGAVFWVIALDEEFSMPTPA